MNEIDRPPTVLMISRDLFFGSKVTGAAQAWGCRVELEGDVASALAKAGSEEFRCIILDLATAGLAVADLTASLPDATRPAVIAYGSHVNAARLQEAVEAGCDEVMPRSRFNSSLQQVLERYCRD